MNTNISNILSILNNPIYDQIEKYYTNDKIDTLSTNLFKIQDIYNKNMFIKIVNYNKLNILINRIIKYLNIIQDNNISINYNQLLNSNINNYLLYLVDNYYEFFNSSIYISTIDLLNDYYIVDKTEMVIYNHSYDNEYYNNKMYLLNKDKYNMLIRSINNNLNS